MLGDAAANASSFGLGAPDLAFSTHLQLVSKEIHSARNSVQGISFELSKLQFTLS